MPEVLDVVLTREQYKKLRDGDVVVAEVEQGGSVSIGTRDSGRVDIVLPVGAMEELLGGSTGFASYTGEVYSIRLP